MEQRFTKRGVGGVGSPGVAQGPRPRGAMTGTDTHGTDLPGTGSEKSTKG